MSLKFIKSPDYLFGFREPAPKIPGFGVTSRRDQWTTAARGGKTYIIRETPTHWIMERYGQDLWARNAARIRRNAAREMRGREFKWYRGEPSKGVWMVAPEIESIAIRKI